VAKSIIPSVEQIQEYKKSASFGSLVSKIYRAGSAYMGAMLKEYNIGAGQHACLLIVAEKPGISQDELSRLLGMDKAHIARAVAMLEKEGFISRREASGDARKKSLSVTASGHALIPKVGEVLQQWDANIFQGITDTEKKQINAILEKIVENIG